MLPILVARQITEGVRSFLKTAFPVATPGFRRSETTTLVDEFLETEGALFKGPWLEIKLPFRTANPGDALPFTHYDMGFVPYQHQVRAFQRLCGDTAHSTIVATGTGSGKTECFMYPLLDHCLRERVPGIKAIIIYPMNALATDQARRFAKECANLDTKLSVGLYTGDDGHDNYAMTADQVITDRQTLRENPPDILLTNYKMLDFLLLRPMDQPLWRHNAPGVLRYLVVDELHTFDGAQGTDLACLIRRLRDKLEAGEELACVGTSATIGDGSAVADLRAYAEQVFATPFDEDSIILEDLLGVDEYLNREQASGEVISRWPVESLSELRPGESEQGVYLRRATELWLGQSMPLDAVDEGDRLKAMVELGGQLLRLTAFHELLRQAHALCNAVKLAEEWRQRLRLKDVESAQILIDSLTALISAARKWKSPEHPPTSPIQKDVEPFLQVRVQLWLRELRRMVASVSSVPTLTHADDLIDLGDPLHLPLLHCRECHALAWGAVKPEGEPTIKPDLQAFYQSWFGKRPDAHVLFPLEPDRNTNGAERRWLCPRCHDLSLQRGASQCPSCEIERVAVWVPDIKRKVPGWAGISSDCPCCGSHESLLVLGARAANLTSVMIGDLFGSAFNDDYKLIAFSDSVQDAAHRSGFFGARTYPQTLRNALAEFIRRQGDGLPLQRAAQEFPSFWRRQTGDGNSFVGTFIAPNMEWLQGYQELKDNGSIPAHSGVENLVSSRLSWEVITEFGLRSRIGRTLERTGVATVIPESERLQMTADRLTSELRENLGTLRETLVGDVRNFLLGLLTRARQHGAYYTAELDSYVRNGGNEFQLNRLHFMPGYGLGNRPPAMLSLVRISNNFETILGKGRWHLDWFNKCLGVDQPLSTSEYEQAYDLTLKCLEKEAWLLPLESKGQPAWGLNPALWKVTTQLLEVACGTCNHRLPVPSQQLHWALGMRCLRQGCFGTYRATPSRGGNGHYRAAPRRLVPSEHTSLLDGGARHEIERSFIEGQDAWDINLLSATPTLEMGINIGNLSSVFLCSVPPAQANYLQRIGRAGRRDGNALAVTVANGRHHDLYFYEEPEEMMAGQVSTPGVFLKAMAVLERQLTAYCFDRWVAGGVDTQSIPGTLLPVLDTVESGRLDGFPHNLLSFAEQHGDDLVRRFLRLFPDLDEEGAGHLEQFLLGSQSEGSLSWRILNRLNELAQSRKGIRDRINELKKRITYLQGQPQDEARDQLLADCQAERGALLALVGSINKRQTLNFFTDEGLLPNYSFPEEGVTLNSVILRRKENRGEDGTGKRYEPVSFTFQRSAQAALGELVPEARFYAVEHQLNIEQVDLKLSKPQTWRLCPNCHYNENIDETGDPHSVCPRCGAPQWADTGQRRTLLKLRQVYARADSRYDRIGDDSDQREPALYRRQLLVDVPPESMQGGYRLASEELPFGFEYLRNVRFREINFGEPGDAAETFHVAGRSEARKGFVICRHCGMVHRQRLRAGQYAHTLDCPLSKPGAQETSGDWITSLYLYRELSSEAIRILLPLADVAQSETLRRSFIAALNMGLRQYFRGNVQHLDITEMQETGQNGHSARQYLVIYDRIPGGTGYLKELMRTPDNLLGLLDQARTWLGACGCADDPEKDGCYRCILAYRESRNIASISRKAALNLLERILELRGSLEAVARLNDIEINSVLGSALEVRFIAALSKVKSVQLTKKPVNGKPGYWLRAGDSEESARLWELEPQVKLGPAQGVMLPTVPDFVLRPVRESDKASLGEWALYLDGLGPHWSIQTDDTRKRMAVLRSGRSVWSLGWHDVPEPGQKCDSVICEFLFKHRHADLLGQYDQLASRFGWAPSAQLDEMALTGSFQIFIDYLTDPEGTLAFLNQGAIRNALGWLHRLSLKENCWTKAETNLKQVLPQSICQWGLNQEDVVGLGGLLEFIGTASPPVEITACVPRASLTSKDRLQHDVGLYLCLDDMVAAQDKVFETSWRGFWHAANLLQFAPRFAVCTRTGIAHQAYESLLDGYFEPIQESTAVPPTVLDAGWEDVIKFCGIPRMELDQIMLPGVPVPEAGIDLTVGSAIVGNAELCWPDLRLALLLEPMDELPHIPDWTLVSIHQADWIEQLLNRIRA